MEHGVCTPGMTQEERVSKLCFFYRVQLMKLQGKGFVTKTMPTNQEIPPCAAELTNRVARLGCKENCQRKGEATDDDDSGEEFCL